MTVIYTETHLTSNPVFENDACIFTVALSSLSIQCRVHHDIHLNYIRNNKIRTGDLIQLYGVLVMEVDQPQYIRINGIVLSTADINIKKRKIDECSFSEICTGASLTRYYAPDGARVVGHRKNQDFKEMEGGFPDFFFCLYGRVSFIIQMLHRTGAEGGVGEDMQQHCTDQVELMQNIMAQIYSVYTLLTTQGFHKLSVINFVNTVKSLIETIESVVETYKVDYPDYLKLDSRVPLPSDIYWYYIMNI